MKRKYIALGAVVVAFLGAGLACWWWFGRAEAPSSKDAITRSETPKAIRTTRDHRLNNSAKRAHVKRAKKVRAPTKCAAPKPETDDAAEPVIEAWVEEVAENYRALALSISTCSDNDDLEGLKKLVSSAHECPEVMVRERMVDALGWFGAKALVELTMFLSDENEDVADSAFNAWDSAVDEFDDESFKINATCSAMKVIRNPDSLSCVATKLESADNHKAAIEAIIEIVESGNEAGAKAAKESYEFISDEPWKDSQTARLKAQTIDAEEEEEDL